MIVSSCSSNEQHIPTNQDGQVVLLISLDGFRYDYLDKFETPNFDRIIRSGVRADGLIPVFPSKTFPNHYSQVTGLYPEHHGIIANKMWDETFKEQFYIGAGSSATRDGKWYGGEPIWVTAEKQHRIAATFFWPGSDAEIAGVRPSHWRHFDNSVAFEDRIDQVVQWLRLPNEKRPAFISLYFENVDQAGHRYGPESAEVRQAVLDTDVLIGKILDQINAAGMTDLVNLIVVSDHGMTQLSRDSIIFIDDYIDNTKAGILNWSPVTDITPPEGEEDRWYAALKDAHPKMSVYRKGSVPVHLHYNAHPRIAPIIAVADPGWSITTHTHFLKNKNAFKGATHGYAPTSREMHGLFIATGPSLAQNTVVEAFEGVHLYALMCHILKLKPASNDGDLEAVRAVLR